MKRYMLWAMFAVAAIVLVLTPQVATAQENFKASYLTTNQGHDGKYDVYSGSGNGTIVGSFTTWDETWIHPWNSLQGTTIITAANGDTLDIVFEQTWDGREWVGTFQIVGGTGRFPDASGGGTMVVISNNNGTFTLTFTGTISF